MEWSLTARWVFPVDRPPLPNGVITIEGERIKAVEPKGLRTADKDLGNVALIPGLVNAHTHLDLSGLRGKAPPSKDFTGWLRQVIAYRRQCEPYRVHDDVRAVQELLSTGTTLVGDICGGSDNPGTSDLLNRCRSVNFYELLGLSVDRAKSAWKAAEAWLREPTSSPAVRKGLSPHAPYSVSEWLFHGVALPSKTMPVAIHLAETREELLLLATHSGPFVDFLKELNVWQPDQLANCVDDILRLFKGHSSFLIIHGNYLESWQVPNGATVVYCPRTHAAFGHDPHPFRDFLKAGIRVALGTDSLASNPDLDVFEEARFVHQRHPDVGGADLLRMITLSGAEALGWANETGSLTPGKSADIVGMPLPNRDDADAHHLLFDARGGKRFVVFQGEVV